MILRNSHGAIYVQIDLAGLLYMKCSKSDQSFSDFILDNVYYVSFALLVVVFP